MSEDLLALANATPQGWIKDWYKEPDMPEAQTELDADGKPVVGGNLGNTAYWAGQAIQRLLAERGIMSQLEAILPRVNALTAQVDPAKVKALLDAVDPASVKQAVAGLVAGIKEFTGVLKGATDFLKKWFTK